MTRCEIEPRSDHTFEAGAVFRAMPEFYSVSLARTASNFRGVDYMTMNGAGTVALLLNCQGELHVAQRGREVILGPGDATLILQGEHFSVANADKLWRRKLSVPLAALTSLAANVEDLAMRLVPRSNPALQLLIGYVKATHADTGIEQPELRSLIASHFHDLIAMSIGATRDGAALAEGRGVAAARLAAIKADIIEHIGQEGLTVEAVAKRQATTPRSIQRLFEREGSTFSAFKQEQRLLRACRMLKDRQFDTWTIAAIALAAGFNDPSYFCRAFSKRFGKTPSDIRSG